MGRVFASLDRCRGESTQRPKLCAAWDTVLGQQAPKGVDLRRAELHRLCAHVANRIGGFEGVDAGLGQMSCGHGVFLREAVGHPGVVEEHLQPRAAFQHVVQRLGQRTLRQQLGAVALRAAPSPEALDHRSGTELIGSTGRRLRRDRHRHCGRRSCESIHSSRAAIDSARRTRRTNSFRYPKGSSPRAPWATPTTSP